MSLKHHLRKLLRACGYDGIDVRRFDRAMGVQASWSTHAKLLDRLLVDIVGRSASPTLLQIGANDGVKDNVSAIALELPSVRLGLVEPNPLCVAKLQSSLGSKRKDATILQTALAATTGKASFYVFDQPVEKGIQLDVFSSFDVRLLENQKSYFGLAANILQVEVDCENLHGISQKCGVDRWDVIMSDIEGYDHEVVRQVCDGQTPPPTLMVFEHEWLSPEQRKQCYERLAASGYALIAGAHDTIAWHMGP